MASTVEAAQSGRTVVLVADDDVNINLLIARLLRHAGYDIIRVPDGRQAIAQIAANHVDVLVLDLMMPFVDGFGVLRHLAQARPDLLPRTIVITAFPESETLAALRSIGAVMAKPFNNAHLLETVRMCATAA